jgi:hypothetical protein
VFEFTEDERISDTKHIENIIAAYRRLGFPIALEDFGAGYAGLNLLASFQPDLIKIDMGLIRNIDTSPARQAIVSALSAMALRLGIQLLAEGIEAEAGYLRHAGISLFQGYYFAKPALEALPQVRAGATVWRVDAQASVQEKQIRHGRREANSAQRNARFATIRTCESLGMGGGSSLGDQHDPPPCTRRTIGIAGRIVRTCIRSG